MKKTHIVLAITLATFSIGDMSYAALINSGSKPLSAVVSVRSTQSTSTLQLKTETSQALLNSKLVAKEGPDPTGTPGPRGSKLKLNIDGDGPKTEGTPGPRGSKLKLNIAQTIPKTEGTPPPKKSS